MEMVIKGGLGGTLISPNREINRSIFHASLNAGVGQPCALAMQLDELRASRVAHLNFLSRPSAIIFRVAKIVVPSIKRVLQRGTRPHIRQEITKVSPRRVDPYPATAIMLIAPMVRVGCSVNHALPGHVLRATPRSSCVAMLLQGVIDKTSARLYMAVTKSCCESLRRLATLTFANPLRVTRLNLGTLDHCQPSKYLSGQVNGASAKRFHITASTRFRVATFQLGTVYHRCCSALAQAFPVRSSLCDMSALYDCQIMEASPREINKCHNVPQYHARLTPSSMATI